MAQRLTSIFNGEEIHWLPPRTLRTRALGSCRQKLGELFTGSPHLCWRPGSRQLSRFVRASESSASQRRPLAVGWVAVRLLMTSFLLCVIAGCSRQSPREAVATEIRGQPIAAANVRTASAATASNESPSLRQGLQAAQAQVGDYVTVGFDKLSSYGFELSDDLLAPATNSAAATEKVESQIPK